MRDNSANQLMTKLRKTEVIKLQKRNGIKEWGSFGERRNWNFRESVVEPFRD